MFFYRTQNGNKYKCRACNKIFAKSSNVNRHYKEHHMGNIVINCEKTDCVEKFSSDRTYRHHLAEKHGNDTFFQCPYCSHKTKRNWNLKRHVEDGHSTVYATVSPSQQTSDNDRSPSPTKSAASNSSGSGTVRIDAGSKENRQVLECMKETEPELSEFASIVKPLSPRDNIIADEHNEINCKGEIPVLHDANQITFVLDTNVLMHHFRSYQKYA